MSINVSNLVSGPARLYVAPTGSTEPADSTVTPNGFDTPPGSPWVDVGGTDGGITVEVDSQFNQLQVDQVPMAVGARLTDLKIAVTATLSELTLGNLQTALNGIGTTTQGTGYETFDLPATYIASQPTYAALIVDGWAPYTSSGLPALRRLIIRKVLSQAKVAFKYDRKAQAGYECTFEAYWLSESLPLVHIVDEQT